MSTIAFRLNSLLLPLSVATFCCHSHVHSRNFMVVDVSDNDIAAYHKFSTGI